METLLVVLHVFILFLLILGLFVMQKKHVSFSKRVFTALGLGIVFGFALQLIYGPTSNIVIQTADWFNIAGGGYVKLLQMVVMPLVFISILGAFTKLKLTKNLGKISGLIIGILVATTAVAAAVGIASALSFDLKAIQVDQGSTELSRGQELQQKSEDMTAKTLPQQIVELLPGNPFLDFTGARPTSTIAVVIFAAFLGVAFLGVKHKQPEQAETFKKLVDAVYAIVMRVVTLILRLTPYGVLAIMTKTIATSDLDSILKLGMFVIASYAALITMFIIHLLLLTFSGLNPVIYLKKAVPVLVFAFTSRSSAGALPLNIKTQRSMGVPEGIANFAGSFGLSIGQNGCAGIYPAMLAMMIAPTVGQNPFDPVFIITVIAVVAISSFGVAGVGGGATFAALLVLSSLNMPVALAGLLISIEPLIDMGRTALNVSGSMTSGLITSKVTKEIDQGAFHDQSRVIEAEEA
ncbi:L-cystine transporter [Bacillus subtilis]|uniref:L-cystine transporter TcyP n=1 Tax=Bacillus subtilis TaxID=1423 RepID=UPI00132E8618|nr:L-cystine transporter TcyP [Bacillus subtilis]MCT6514409.1 L-cystine transporter TcyP [Bacillus subtilis]MCX4075720.1 L-cystine transporter TcyP [Bacillus subtilis]MEC0394527.1 L-cystine transporter TcyP [Bacillus subtilis]MEC0435063.1 L-cystine transporter TcyP [Bacillus subtilis]QHF56835.1 uptake protein [Bacillus subtilis]